MTAEQWEISVTVVIKSDHTYQATIIDDEGTENETGTWSVSGNELTLTDSVEGPEELEFTIQGNKLTITVTEVDEGVNVTMIQEFEKQ